MSSSKEISNENSDINDGGALLSLLDIEFNNNTAISENVDNKLDQKSKHNRMLYDPNNRILISIDQGIHGASKEKLIKISKLHHRKPANVESQGLKGVGEKGYVFHFSDLFRNPEYSDTPVIDPNIQNILDKPIKERTPIENLRLAPRYISKTDEFDDDNDTGFNSISLNVIPPVFQNAQYKNVPTTMGPFDMALWDAFSIDPEKPGTISFTHVSQKRHEELMLSLSTFDIQKNLPLFFSTHYHEFLSNDTKMEIGLVSFDIKNENRLLVIKKDIIKLTQIIPFDPLHFVSIEPKHKTSGTIIIYKKNKNINLLDNERLQYESEPKEKFIYKNENDEYFKMMEDKASSKENNKFLVKIENIEEERKYYIEIGKVTHKGTYEHDWKFKDDIILEKICECSQGKIKNKPSLNGSYTIRNKKQINHSNPPNKSSGDFSVRKAYKNCRFERSYESTIDEYIPPLLNKSKLAWHNVHEELRELIDLVEKEFREKIGKMYKLQAKPIPNGGSCKKKSVKIESDSESDSDDVYSGTDDNSIVSSAKKPNTASKNKEVSTAKPKIVAKQIATPAQVVNKIRDNESISSVSSSDESENENEGLTNQIQSEKPDNQAQSVALGNKLANISLTVSEQANDSASNSDSESSNSSKPAVDIKKVIRKESEVDIIPKEISLQQLRDWLIKPYFHDELEKHLLIIWSETYKDLIHKDIFEDIYPQLDIQTKVNLLIKHINNKYKSKNVQIAGATGLNIAYKAYVK